ncbi:hypothetical protein [Ornithinimicrobium faecis]|uniref:Uncharacterized protein n=1 Tax=Ornithinimicrobium faecis TaxID=2934158 RepID=A0ABY4YVQ6_9MICO|nr:MULTISPECIES: hypothetical protein [unclassified Ornithinimicrobium]USQ80565.1 hypothetical protein NF556_02555 [Ornithinimicrobium sp. HY1793]
MATDGPPDRRSDIVRSFDRWPKPLRVVVFALAVSFAVVMTISYLAQGRWGMVLLWLVITAVWSMIALVRMGEADRFDGGTTDGRGGDG